MAVEAGDSGELPREAALWLAAGPLGNRKMAGESEAAKNAVDSCVADCIKGGDAKGEEGVSAGRNPKNSR